MYNNDLSELIVNNLGSEIDLTLNTTYICPSDGYVRVNCSYGSSNYSFVEICGADDNNPFTFLTSGNNAAGGNSSLYVRKGTKVKFLGGTGSPESHFHPLEN